MTSTKKPICKLASNYVHWYCRIHLDIGEE